MKGRHAHRFSTLALSAAMVVIGVALIVQAVGGHGGVPVRAVLGLLFLAAGALRIYLLQKRSERT